MNNLFSIKTKTKNEYNFLYKLYKAGKDNKVHNLSKISHIPIEFRSLLSLGLKFVIPKKVNYKTIKECICESVRKISWNIFFSMQQENRNNTVLENWFIKCKKDWRKINRVKGPLCPITEEIFNVNNLFKETKCRMQNCITFVTDLLQPTISNFLTFCRKNNLMVIESDKNAGICIVDNNDYDGEVFRQLHDSATYHPTTFSHFISSMNELKDKINCFKKKNLPPKIKINSLLMNEDKPAKFYILPKVHKPFSTFPKGRPISSTFTKTNKYVSSLLDVVLKPCTNIISDLLIDTQHFLLLLNEVELQNGKKYVLITVDIEGLYTNLKIQDCKKHCLSAFKKSNVNNELNLNLNDNDFLDLMSLSLDYNYVQYKNELFFQFRGIEMGNAASVMIANITVFFELHNMLVNKPEICFHKRFLDDLFLIVEVDAIGEVNEWVNTTFNHPYLKFTHEFSNNSINFLDVQVQINHENKIITSLYRKPMNKHIYLEATSDHPVHLKNSLFYSQGLRLVRICSDYKDRLDELMLLYKKFLSRGYKNNILYPTFIKLCTYKRFTALSPKKKLLLSHLQIHNQEIFSRYHTEPKVNVTHGQFVYLIFPFYKCVKQYRKVILECILDNVDKYATNMYKNQVKKICIKLVYARTKNLKEALTL